MVNTRGPIGKALRLRQPHVRSLRNTGSVRSRCFPVCRYCGKIAQWSAKWAHRFAAITSANRWERIFLILALRRKNATPPERANVTLQRRRSVKGTKPRPHRSYRPRTTSITAASTTATQIAFFASLPPLSLRLHGRRDEGTLEFAHRLVISLDGWAALPDHQSKEKPFTRSNCPRGFPATM